MTLLKTSLIFASSFLLLACADDSEQLPPTENAQSTVTAFGSARDALSQYAESHTTSVMAQDQLRDITLDELGFHDASFSGLAEMQWHLESLAACWDSSGVPLDRNDAFAALQELRGELRAHQISMITMVDTDTARVAELIFHDRQVPLLEELQAHFDAFTVTAADYQCTF